MIALCWTGARIAVLWHSTGSLPEAIGQAVPIVAAEAASPTQPHVQLASHILRPALPPNVAPLQAVVPAGQPLPRSSERESQHFMPLQPASHAGPLPTGHAPAAGSASGAAPVQATPFPVAPVEKRWSGSAWVVARPGQGIGAAPGAGQLGGSQAGVRLVHSLSSAENIALAVRFATPLEGRGREAALGIEWQPAASLPVRLLAEVRVPADASMRGGPALGAVAGFDQTVAPGVRLEAYGQAGAVFRARTEPYADGAARVTTGIASTPIALGVGAWGAAQNDGARLDIGPTAVLGLSVGGQPLRIALDWRQRVAGDVRPGSGAALTVGTDF